MSENKDQNLQNVDANSSVEPEEEHYSLNDDRRVKSLSPGALVVRRFFRNRIAVVGLFILIFMFLFCFLGAVISPYSQNEIFYTTEYQNQEYVAATENTEYRYLELTDDYGAVVKALTGSAIEAGSESFEYGGAVYNLIEEGDGFYSVYAEMNSFVAADAAVELSDDFQSKALETYLAGGGTFKSGGALYEVDADGNITTGGTAYATVSYGESLIGAAYLGIISAEDTSLTFPVDFQYDAQMAYAQGGGSFEYDGVNYDVDDEGVIYSAGEEYAVISRFVVNSATAGRIITSDYKAALSEALEAGVESFEYTDENGETSEYTFSYDPTTGIYSVLKQTETRVYDTYSFPSREHWLGTDKNGMDMLSRVMYGGRISLLVGFIVVIVETLLGVILGGVAGYFGGWVDQVVMRIVDVFYCIPSTPLIIILGAAMDAMRVSSLMRIIYLMLILGFLGWPYIARTVRGQILSFREQEFMVAAEACGIRSSRRIFRHLVPNVMPQLIVLASTSIGSTILTEATLSYLGLGVKFPFASWGSIINDVSNSYVLTNYWFIWIPAGICLMLTVLGFNFVGDGLRDAFDPRMKR